MISILGPTACGKTKLAAYTAYRLNGEIISADSRQVYRGMDLGTGKDLSDYIVDNQQIPFHLIDIVSPEDQYNVYRFTRDFMKAYDETLGRGRLPILCGGSGLYLQAVLEGYNLLDIPPDPALEDKLSSLSLDELTVILASYGPVHALAELREDKVRMIREIVMKEYFQNSGHSPLITPRVGGPVFGISCPRPLLLERITSRLQERLKNGMIDEVKTLIENGLDPLRLISFGLEYKYVTLYLTSQLSRDEMFNKLNTAIHQFSKRQMTWFRRMERKGIKINWLDCLLPLEEKFNIISDSLNK